MWMYLAILFAVLWAATLSLFYFYYKKPVKQMDVDAQKLLADVMSSGAVVRIEVLDPQNLMYYRGK